MFPFELKTLRISFPDCESLLLFWVTASACWGGDCGWWLDGHTLKCREAGSALNEFPWRNYHGGASSRAEPGQVQVKLSTGSKAQSESRTLMVSGPDQPRLISGEMAGPDR